MNQALTLTTISTPATSTHFVTARQRKWGKAKCLICGGEFQSRPGTNHPVETCSRECGCELRKRRNKVERTCPICGKKFSTIKSLAHDCCSFACGCAYRSIRNGVTRICVACGKEIEHKAKRHKYCKACRKARSYRFKHPSHRRIADNIRARIIHTLKGRSKPGHTFTFVGCSKSQLVKHLESKFKPGMNWANYAKYWHLGHAIPCASFDPTDTEQLKRCWHFSNLYPEYKRKNMQLNAKVVPNCQPEFLIEL